MTSVKDTIFNTRRFDRRSSPASLVRPRKLWLLPREGISQIAEPPRHDAHNSLSPAKPTMGPLCPCCSASHFQSYPSSPSSAATAAATPALCFLPTYPPFNFFFFFLFSLHLPCARLCIALEKCMCTDFVRLTRPLTPQDWRRPAAFVTLPARLLISHYNHLADVRQHNSAGGVNK